MINYFSNNIGKIYKAQKILLFLLLALIPYHYMIVCVLLKNFPILKLWKELIIFILFISVILIKIINKKLFKITFGDLLIIIFFLIDMIYIFISPNIIAAINISRIYIIPMLLLYIVKNIPLNDLDISRGAKLLIINTCVIGLFGIFQQLLLGDEFLIHIGYELNTQYDYQRLTDSFYMSGAGLFQRNTATFVSPNVAGLYFSFILTMGVVLFKRINCSKIILSIMLSIITLSIILTFSRTSWIALMFGIFIFLIISIKWTKKKLLYLFIICFVILFLIFVFDKFFMNNKIITLLYNTITLKDTSILSHLSSWVLSWQIVKMNILGCGLGSNGPRAIAYFHEPLLTESSYFLLFFELGIFGFVSYCSIILYSIKNTICKIKNDSNILLAILILFEILVAFMSLPYIQDVEITIVLFVCLGYLNAYALKNFSKEEI